MMMILKKKKQDVGVITVALLLLGLLLTFTLFQSAMAAEDSSAGGLLCESKCGNRCSKAGVQDRCLKYCGVCCAKCQCVPSGTYGNKHECPCYRDMINSKGNPKCP